MSILHNVMPFVAQFHIPLRSECYATCLSLASDEFTSRVKIMIAAHAGLMCVASCKFGQQPEHIQLEIMKKHHEKS